MLSHKPEQKKPNNTKPPHTTRRPNTHTHPHPNTYSPNTNVDSRVSVVDFASRLHTTAIREFASAMLILAGLVLLAACASVGAGLTARTLDRQREIGIRISLGAGRLRVVRMVLIEAFVMVGVSVGIALAMVWRVTDFLSELAIQGFSLPIQVDVHPDV